MRVTLLAKTENAEFVCAKAMRSTRTDKSADEIVITKERAIELLRLARSDKHLGVFEHATFTVCVSGVSRVLTHQLVRHRIASYLQQSQRQVAPSERDWYVMPPSIGCNVDDARQNFEKLMDEIAILYCNFTSEYNIPKEDARYILPNACKTHIVITMNARQWLHFFWVRCGPTSKAQWEIKEMALAILKELRSESPVFFEELIDC